MVKDTPPEEKPGEPGRSSRSEPERIEDLLREMRPDPAPAPGGAHRPGCADDRTVQRFLSRTMKSGEKRLFEEHIARCDACRSILADTVRRGAAPGAEPAGGLLTRPPSFEPSVPGASRSGGPARLRRAGIGRGRWLWGLGLGTPAAAAICVLLVLVFAGPGVRMAVQVERAHLVRSSRGEILKDGEVLRRGDRIRLEIRSTRDGYVYGCLWNAARGGRFLFPSPSVRQDHRIVEGEPLVVPAEGAWVLDEPDGGEETLYLLFTREPLSLGELDAIAGDLSRQGRARSRVEEILSRHFRIEQEISYRLQ